MFDVSNNCLQPHGYYKVCKLNFLQAFVVVAVVAIKIAMCRTLSFAEPSADADASAVSDANAKPGPKSEPSSYAMGMGGHHYSGYYGQYVGPTYYGAITYTHYGYPSYGYAGRKRLYKRMSDTNANSRYEAYGYGNPNYGL